MRITDGAIRFRVTVAALMVLVLVGGLWAYLELPKEASPAIEIPLVMVNTPFPGASPEEIEALVTFPIERELQGVEGVEEIRSTSREGVSLVLVEFRTDVTLTEANQRVRERVDLARAALPAEAEEPLIQEFAIDQVPILTVNLRAPYPLARLTEVADRLQDELEGIAGVLEAEVVGGVIREVQVNVDLAALEGYGLSFEQVAQVIEQENTSLPGGSIEVDRVSYQVRVDGRFDDPAVIADLVIHAPEGRPVYVRDVAEVVPEGFADRMSYARIRELWREDERGRPVPAANARYDESVSLSVRARSGENVLEIAEEVRAALAELSFPAGTELVITGDRSEEIGVLVEEMENHIILGVLLVTLSLLFFLGLRPAMLAGLSIPLTMMLTFIVFFALGETLNFIVLFTLIVVLGILVDFSIVVVENIQRHAEAGHGPWDAARRAARQVGWPVTAGLTTTMAVFVPLLFWGGVVGEFLRYLPLTMIITLSSALLVAIIMVPVAAGYMLGTGLSPLARRLILGAVAFIGLVLLLYNPVTLLAVALVAAAIGLLYRYALAPGTDWFRGRVLPATETHYRQLLEATLARDYHVPRAMLRNTAALAALAGGLALLLLGAAITALLGLRPGLVALVPGGLLLVAGLLGALVHFLETVFLGGRWSIRAGAALGLVALPFLLVRLVQGELTPRVLLALLFVPALLVGLGAAGQLFQTGRRHLLLTDNRARALHLVVGGLVVVALAYAIAPTGAAFFPDTDPAQARIEIEAPGGTSIEAANAIAGRAVDRIEDLIRRDDAVAANVESIVVNVGVAGLGPFGGGQADPRRSRITLTMVDYRHRAEPSRQTVDKVRSALTSFPGAVIRIEEMEMGPPAPAPIEIEFSGPEFARVMAFSMDAERRLRDAMRTGRITGMVDLVNTTEAGSPELLVRVDRERAAMFGLSTAEIAAGVRAAIEGRIAGSVRDGQDEHDIRVRLREQDRETLQSVEALTLVTPEAQVPLLAMAQLEEAVGPGVITRVDLSPVVTLEANVAEGFRVDQVMDQVDAVVGDLRQELPDGYTMRYAGEAEEREEAFDFLGLALVLGVALMGLVLVTKFNSVLVPVVILSAVMLTMTGVVMGLVLTRAAFSIMTFLAVISLAGIVADDDIVLSEFILKHHDHDGARDVAVVEGGVSRFRQVVLTAVTTIIGLIPLTLGFHIDFQGLFSELRPDLQIGSANAQFWGPLGSAVIFGLPAATVVTLVYVPVAYSVADSLRRRRAGR